ncbi:hypothetical protein QTP86_004807, partial [Hemibagrus guttatus]
GYRALFTACCDSGENAPPFPLPLPIVLPQRIPRPIRRTTVQVSPPKNPAVARSDQHPELLEIQPEQGTQRTLSHVPKPQERALPQFDEQRESSSTVAQVHAIREISFAEGDSDPDPLVSFEDKSGEAETLSLMDTPCPSTGIQGDRGVEKDTEAERATSVITEEDFPPLSRATEPSSPPAVTRERTPPLSLSPLPIVLPQRIPRPIRRTTVQVSPPKNPAVARSDQHPELLEIQPEQGTQRTLSHVPKPQERALPQFDEQRESSSTVAQVHAIREISFAEGDSDPDPLVSFEDKSGEAETLSLMDTPCPSTGIQRKISTPVKGYRALFTACCDSGENAPPFPLPSPYCTSTEDPPTYKADHCASLSTQKPGGRTIRPTPGNSLKSNLSRELKEHFHMFPNHRREHSHSLMNKGSPPRQWRRYMQFGRFLLLRVILIQIPLVSFEDKSGEAETLSLMDTPCPSTGS